MSRLLRPDDPLAIAMVEAIRTGEIEELKRLLRDNQDRGANRNWIATWDGHTPLDTARREGADELVAWLRARGAKTADELTGRTKEGG